MEPVSTLIPTMAVVLSVLGPALPDTGLRVERIERPRTNSVFVDDTKINLTNRVLDRSICTDVVRVHADVTQPLLFNTASTWEARRKETARRNNESVNTHCQTSLRARGIGNEAAHCGTGLTKRK